MCRCLELARLGAGWVSPNPMVGAVLVHEDRVIGEGYHQHFGGPHAEVLCLDAVQEADRPLIPFSTLYVSLEPCAHHGKTPPCTERIIREGIRSVVIACRDPFPQVDGRGVEQLLSAGIEVKQGLREAEATELNRRFFTFHTRQRPFVILKWAESADGAIAGPDRQPVAISGEATRRLVHRWRSEEAAILVGAETVLQDNPRLTNRFHAGRQPVRIVLDGELRVPFHFNVYNDEAPTLIINRKEQREEGRLHYLKVRDTRNLDEVLERIAGIGIMSILVEGGAEVLNAFMAGNYADEIRRLVSTTERIPGGYAAPEISRAIGCALEYVEEVGQDLLEYYRNKEMKT